MKAKSLPNLNYLKECFEINSNYQSGLKWKIRPKEHFKSEIICIRTNKICSNQQAGYCDMKKRSRYYIVKLDGLDYRCHRIIYALHHNTTDFSESIIDHKDGNALNNNPSNLRLATFSQNAHNRKIHKNNSIGEKNIIYCKKKKRYRVRFKINKKVIEIKSCDTLEEAIKIRDQKIKELAGEFYRKT